MCDGGRPDAAAPNARERDARRQGWSPLNGFRRAAPRRSRSAIRPVALSVKASRRLAQLGEEYELDAAALAAYSALLGVLEDPVAPTSIHRPGLAVDVHIADSLAGLLVPELRTAVRVADLGSGAGLPGLVLAAALPMVRFDLIESNARKCGFILAAADAMDLGNVTVVQSRVEEWRPGQGTADCVCARAVATLPVLLEYAAPLLRVGGSAIAWKGDVSDEERSDGAAAAVALGYEPAAVLSVTPFPRSERRSLHVFRKDQETPARYPRRAGMAVKRPLSAST